MNHDWHGLGRVLLVAGLVLAGIGLLVLASPKLPWLGRLPGDILIQRGRTTFYAPIATCLLLSLLVSVILWLINRFR